MNRIRWIDMAAIVATIAIIAGLGFAMRPVDTAKSTIQPTAAHTERPRPLDASRPTALFIGDSYPLGTGSAEMSYACMAAVRVGWYCKLSALPGTGFISGGTANRFLVDPYLGNSTSFIERIPHLADLYQPDVVVFDGGRNDQMAPVEDVFDVMRGTIEQARQVWPKATMVLIRPRFLARPDDDLGYDDDFFTGLVDDIPGLVVLDPLKKFSDYDTSAMLKKDRIHPNRLGDLAITATLAESLSSHRLANPT
ncbi:SGNH/GDSL hydrolase family protein [Mycobacterium sp. URHB0021]|jgi:hypothetical protein